MHTADAKQKFLRPSADMCREQLARILRSTDFDATDREHRFLEYVVEECLSGRNARIKAYNIAVEVFGRLDTFDPQVDPIVRIAASHLRRSLERYYLTAGKSDPLVIGIPTGSYIPTFLARSPGDEGVAPRTGVTAPLDRPLPGADDIRAQLERLALSSEFPNTGRTEAFLSYIVEEVLAGRGNRIKGYAIALEVFKRRDDFTQDDPVVRIEAGRLRRALERYYLVAGQNDPVRIDVPKGGYVPVFHWNAAAPAEGDSAVGDDDVTAPSAHERRLPRLPRLGFIGTTVALAIALAASCWTVGRYVSVSPGRLSSKPDGPTLVIAPLANLGSGPNSELYTKGLTEELLTALPRFKEIKVFGRETSTALPADVAAAQVRDELGAHYLLAGGVRVSDTRIRVTARLVDTSDGAILWSQDYDNDLRSRDLFAIQSDVANKVATAIAQPYGVIAHVDLVNPPPDDFGAYECTLGFYAYRAELTVERHAKVRECLERAVARYPGYVTAWGMLSIIYLDEGRFQFNPKPGSPAPLQRSLQAARRATQLDPDNSRALQALMTALFFNQQPDEALRVGEQALAANPNDTELKGEIGTRLAMGGQWERGAALLDEALALNPGGGGYFHGTRALAAYMLRDNQTAVAEIRQADLQKFSLFHVVAAVIFAEADMLEDARLEGETFMRMRPDFIPNIEEELRARNFRLDDQLRLVASLRKAGLPVPAGVEASISRSAAGP
ncbi:adenylate cyclase [Rhizobium binxianense]|uniref:adenylate cyclase n=1 Tax=Rhizobium binxianense TaxID=3024242 RepID=UPI00234F3203|nr:adenylate cyclase [Rhizobium sp. BC56]MDC7741221.1 adenylate cyclase [Rhizobium sp. BC56]